MFDTEALIRPGVEDDSGRYQTSVMIRFTAPRHIMPLLRRVSGVIHIWIEMIRNAKTPHSRDGVAETARHDAFQPLLYSAMR
jgi:hypothetical protein